MGCANSVAKIMWIRCSKKKNALFSHVIHHAYTKRNIIKVYDIPRG